MPSFIKLKQIYTLVEPLPVILYKVLKFIA